MDEQTSELTEPCVGSFNDPAAFVASQFPAIVISPFLVVAPVRSDQFDSPLLSIKSLFSVPPRPCPGEPRTSSTACCLGGEASAPAPCRP